MRAVRGARGVDHGGLHGEHVRMLGDPAGCHRVLTCLDLCPCAAEVHRGGAFDVGRRPWHGAVQSEIDLRGRRPVPVGADRAGIAVGDVRVGQQQPRGGVQQQQVAGARVAPIQVGEASHVRPRLDAATVCSQVVGERVGDPLCSTARERPPFGGVCVRGEEQAGSGSGQGRERGVPVREHAREQSLDVGGERRLPGLRARQKHPCSEPRHHEGMTRHPQELVAGDRHQLVDATGQRLDQPAVGGTSGPEIVHRAVEVMPRDRRPSAVERLRVGGLGRDPLDALAEPERAEERRASRRRMHRRSDVVPHPGQGEAGRAHAAADGARGLEHVDVVAGARERDRRGEPVRAAAHDRRTPRHGPSVALLRSGDLAHAPGRRFLPATRRGRMEASSEEVSWNRWSWMPRRGSRCDWAGTRR